MRVVNGPINPSFKYAILAAEKVRTLNENDVLEWFENEDISAEIGSKYLNDDKYKIVVIYNIDGDFYFRIK